MADPVLSRARVLLELEADSDPPAGSLWGPDGRRRDFRGWLELAALLERCRHIPGKPTSGAGSEPS